MEIQQGAVLSLTCRVEGETNPVIHWFKDGVPIDSQTNGRVNIVNAVKRSQLRLHDIQIFDSGNYSCEGESAQNQVGKWVYVNVYPAPNKRKAGDDEACPVNSCHVGECFMINNRPTCRCPPNYTGPQCTEFVDQSFMTPATMDSSESTTVEEDFILDQSNFGLSNQDQYQSTLQSYINKCDLPEYQYTTECTQVNSHFYAFIATAVTCSVVILLLGTCLGYIRRRKILNRQNRTEKSNRCKSKLDTKHLRDNLEIQRNLRVASPGDRRGSPIFTGSEVQSSPESNPLRVSVASDISSHSITLSQGPLGFGDCDRTKPNTPKSTNSGIPFSHSTYVVLTTATPVALHPQTDSLHLPSALKAPRSTDMAQCLNPPIQSASPAISGHSTFKTELVPVELLESNKDPLRYTRGLFPPPNSDKIYVQLPPLGTSFYLANQIGSSTSGSSSGSKHRSLAEGSRSGVTDKGLGMIVPIPTLETNQPQSVLADITMSPPLKSLNWQTDTHVNLNNANPDCVPQLLSKATVRTGAADHVLLRAITETDAVS